MKLGLIFACGLDVLKDLQFLVELVQDKVLLWKMNPNALEQVQSTALSAFLSGRTAGCSAFSQCSEA